MPRCTWDPKKAAANLKKHKVSFPEAATVFDDKLALGYPDEVDPEREITIGHSKKNNLLLVVFIEYVEAEVVRIISARYAEASERRKYEEGVSHA